MGGLIFRFPTSPLKAYSEVFNFVEVNYTFYEYPDTRTVERWRRTVPKGFTFAVHCHQDLTHKIGLKPVDEAYQVLNQMKIYCGILQAPFLVLETPSKYVLDKDSIEDARDLFSSISLKGVRLVWEIRASVTSAVVDLMQHFNVVNCVDLSREEPSFESDIVYSRLFGKGKHNIYQFTDDELVETWRKVENTNPRIAASSYHGVRMNTDAARFMKYKKTGTFVSITSFAGADCARAVLSEDAHFPSSKSELIDHKGWKEVDLTLDKKIPDKTYNDVDEIIQALEAIM